MPITPDPNALSILLRGQTQPSRYTETDESLNELIPEESLYQAQEAIGARGRAGGGAYAIPSRESLRGSGLAELKRLFGIQQAEAQAKAYPARVTGEYNLAREGVRSQGNLAAAEARAAAEAAEATRGREFTQGQQGREQTFRAGESALGRQSAADIAASRDRAAMDRAREVTGRAAATQASIGARQNPPGALASLYRLFFGGPDEAAQPAAGGPAAELAPLRNDPRFANLTFEDLVQQGIIEADSPEELAIYQQAWGR